MRQTARRGQLGAPRALARVVMAMVATAMAAGPARASVIGVVWEPQAVRHPVSIDQLTPARPYVPAEVPLERAAVTVGPDAGLALWLKPADLVRVRALDVRHQEALRFARLVAVKGVPTGSPAARMVVHEPGLRAGDTEWYLVEPPGVGALWHVSAVKPTRVLIERPRAERGRLIWEVVRSRVLAWIERGGPMPGLPLGRDTTELELRLRADAAVHAALLRAYPGARSLERALVAWRKASALAGVDAARPALAPYMVRERIDGDLQGGGIGGLVELTLVARDGEDEDVASQPYRQVHATEASWRFELEGPGVLQVEARARLGRSPQAVAPRELAVELTAGGALLASSSGPAVVGDASGQPSWELALPADRPLSVDGELVSLRRRFTLPLLAGRHTYQLTLTGGPALIRVFAMHRRGRLLETLAGRDGPEDFIERTEEELAAMGSADAPAVGLVRALLDELRMPLPTIRPGASRLPPVLELVALRAQARRQHLEASAAEELAARVHRLLGRISTDVDPTLIWMLRVELAQAFTRWNLDERARQLLDQAADMGWPEVPEAMGGLVGAYLPERASAPVQPSLVLAAAERAWRDRPVEAGRRRHYLLTWRRKTRWSQLAPDALVTAAPAPPAWRWLDTTVVPSGCGATVSKFLFPPGRGLLYAAPVGRECWYEAAAMRTGPERPAIVRVHLVTEDARPGPITVSMGRQAWSTLAFQRVETLELAVPPGRYPVRVDAPAGILAYVGVPAPPRLGSQASATAVAPVLTPLRRRWPLAVDGVPVRYRLPEPQRIGPVRVELRELIGRAGAAGAAGPAGGRGGAPVEVTVHTDAGAAARVSLLPGPVDARLADLDAPALVSLPAVFVTWLPPGARELWLEADGARALVASVSFRRAAGRLLPEEQIHDDPAGEVAELPEPADIPAPAASAAALAPDSDSGCAVTATPERDLTRAIYRRSRCLHGHPDSPAALRWLIERADLFLELGRGDHARTDLEAARRGGAALGPWRAEYQDVARRLADWRRMSHLRPQPTPLLAPMPIAPSWLALEATAAELEPWVPRVRAAREHGPAALLAAPAGSARPAGALAFAGTAQAGRSASGLVATYVQARLSRMAGDRASAADLLTRAYRASGHWQLGVDALADLEAILLLDPPELRHSLASLTYGIARELRARVEHAQIRRAISIASHRSRTEPVRGVYSHAGFERVIEDARASEPDATSELDWARLGPPWSLNQGQLVRPGQGARVSFRLEQPATVWAEAFCGLLADESCPFSVRVDGRIDPQGERIRMAPRARRTALPAVTLGPGEHAIEVMFETDDLDARASIRFVAGRPIGNATAIAAEPARPAALAVRRPGQLYIARPDRPIVLDVAGPTVLAAELRASAGEATTAQVTAEPIAPLDGHGPMAGHDPGRSSSSGGLLAGGGASQRQVVLATEPDPGLLGRSSRGILLAQASQELILLPGHTAYRVTVRATGGLVHARFTLRRDIERAPAAREPEAMAMAPLPQLHTPGPRVDRPHIQIHGRPPPEPPGRSSTLIFELGAGRSDAGIDDLSGDQHNRLDAAILWRRRLIPERLWLGVDARAAWTVGHSGGGDSDTGDGSGGDSDTGDGSGTGSGSDPVAGLYVSTHLRKLHGLRLDVRGRVLTQRFDGALQVAARAEIDLDTSVGISPSVWLLPALGLDYRYQTLDALEPRRRAELDSQVFSNYARDHAQTLTPRVSLFWVPFQDQVAVLSAQLVSNADLASVDLIAARAAWRGIIEVVPLFGPVLELDYRLSRRFQDQHRPGDYDRHDLGAALAWTVWRGASGRLVVGVSERLYISTERLYRTTPTRENVVRLSLRFDWTGGRGLVDLLPRELDFDDFQEPRLWSRR